MQAGKYKHPTNGKGEWTMKVMERFSLKGQVSIITGGARGLGKAMAYALAQAGSNIVIADLQLDQAQKTATDIQADEGVQTLALKVDVTDEEQVSEMVRAVESQFGRIDVLFNNAGIAYMGNLEDMAYSEWNKMMDVNLNSLFLVSKHVVKVMMKQNKGSIVNISSMSGLIANTPQKQTAYNTSKAGVIMLTKSSAAEWVEHGIRVNAIAPGYMQTEMTKPYFEGNEGMVKQWMELTPMGRPGNPEELAGLAVFLASDASSYVTGAVHSIDGGYTIW
jgi:NAD(P)-dependent dehydrogenase (short-subunit alcohol dehydrogenase family)